MTQFRHHGVRTVADVAAALTEGLALLDAAAAPGPVEAVWWLPERPALVLGRGSPVATHAAAGSRRDLDVVRRSSGGGPVLWDPALLALDVVIPRGHPRFTDDVTSAYEWIGLALAAAVAQLGPDARPLTVSEARESDDPSAGRLACFAGRSPWEVVVGGRKLIGLSQTRRRPGTLVQVGILAAVDPAALPRLLDLPPDTSAALATTLERTTVGLAELDLEQAAVIAAIDGALAAASTVP